MTVYEHDDLVYGGEHALEQGDAPLFESLTEYGVICIVERLLSNVECLGEGHTFLEHKYPYELGYSHRGMRVVELNGIAFGKV